MKALTKEKKLSPAREIAYTGMAVALLLGGQLVFSAVVGVEIVTIILAVFSYNFGAKRGALAATAFSLLRCAIYGFYPAVVILYLVYYPLLAVVFGLLGNISDGTFARGSVKIYIAAFVLLAAVCAASVWGAVEGVSHVTSLWRTTGKALLWTVFSLAAAGLAALAVLFFMQMSGKCGAQGLKLVTLCAVGAVCTIVFTLADDVISPLVAGMGEAAARAYFYASFTAMVPQTLCTVCTFAFLFLPLSAVLKRVKKP